MKQQKGGPNPIITVLLWGAFIFLGMQLFCPKGPNAKDDTRKTAEVFEQIQELNKDRNDQAMVDQVKIYEAKLENEKQAGLITAQQKDARVFDAKIIEFATTYSNALAAKNQGKLNALYNNTLRGFKDKNENTELWERQVKVAPVEGKIDDGTVTPEELYNLVVADLRVMNKDAKVLGYIPGYKMMDWLVQLTGGKPYFSYWFAALLLAFLVRLAVFPLAQKQYMWGRRMSQLAPYAKEIREKYTDKKTKQITDQQAMSMETMELYKKYGFNPLSGCLPLFVQIPLFLIIYNCMLLYRFEFNSGFFLWIAPESGRFLSVPLAESLGEKDYILIVIYGISMIVTTLLTPVSDPSNIRQQRLIGLAMAVMVSVFMFIWPLPSAFVLYWIFTNVLATAQSLYVYRLPIEPLTPVQTTVGGAIPTTGRDMNGKASGVDPGFFGKTGKGKSKKKKR